MSTTTPSAREEGVGKPLSTAQPSGLGGLFGDDTGLVSPRHSASSPDNHQVYHYHGVYHLLCTVWRLWWRGRRHVPMSSTAPHDGAGSSRRTTSLVVQQRLHEPLNQDTHRDHLQCTSTHTYTQRDHQHPMSFHRSTHRRRRRRRCRRQLTMAVRSSSNTSSSVRFHWLTSCSP